MNDSNYSETGWATSPHEGLRVMFVVPGESDGSGLPIALREAASIRELGVRVHLFYLRSRTSPVQLMRDCLRLRRQIRRFRPDVIHAQFGTITSFFCAVTSRVPLVITFRGSDLHGDADFSPIRSKMGQLLSQLSSLLAARVICVSSELQDRLWWCKRRSVVLCSGTDLQLFSPQPQDTARKLLRWEKDFPVVVFAGRNRPLVKGLQLVQEAVRVAEKIIGPIRLEFLQVPYSMMPRCLNAAECLAVGSLTEGSPNIVREALACNLPIVSTPVGDVPELLKNVNPSAIAARDPEEFGKALARILGRKCRSDGRERGDLKSNQEVAAAIVSVYRSAIVERRGLQQSVETPSES